MKNTHILSTCTRVVYRQIRFAMVFCLFSGALLAVESFQNWDIALPNRFVKEIHESKNFIWVGTAKGLVQYDKRSKKVQTYNTARGLPDDFITSMTIDEQETTAFVGTAGGLAQIDLTKNKITAFTKRNSKISDNRVNTVFYFKDVLFIGTTLGIDTYSPVTNTWKAYTAIEGLAGGNIQQLASDGYYVWAAGADGISYYDQNEDTWYSFGVDNGLNSNLVTSLVVNTDVVWVGTMGGGISRFDRTSFRFDPYTSEEGLIDDNVQELIDDGKLLWIATFGGVSRMDKNTLIFTNFDAKNGLTEASATSGMIQGENLYIGTDGGGVFILDKGIPEISLLPSLSGYVRKGEIEVYASISSKNPIKSLILYYKQTASADEFDYSNLSTVQKWNEIKNVSRAQSSQSKLTTLKTSEWPDGKYLLRAEIEDNKGNTNESTVSIIVDNKAPSVDLIFRPPEEGAKFAVVAGSYKELNLSRLDVKIGNKTVIPEINRQSRRFRFNFPLDSPDKIKISAEDIGKNTVEVSRDFIIDRDPPVLEVNPVDVARVKANVVEITGSVKEANIDRVLVLPDNVEAELKPSGTDSYTFLARAQVKKEGKYAYQITATDKMGNSTVKTLEIDFVSKITIVDVRKDRIPEYTLKNKFEFSGNILGPPLKEFYLTEKSTNKRIDIPVRKDKTFNEELYLNEGDNSFAVTKIFSDDHKEDDSFTVTYSRSVAKASLDLGTTSFKEKFVTLRGKYDRGVIKVFLNKKAVTMNDSEKSFTVEILLKDGKNTVELSWIDELNRVTKKDYTLFVDSQPPEMFVRALPDQTSLKTIKVRGKVSDNVASLISGYPGVEIQKIDPKTGEFEAVVKLENGGNNIHFSALDPAGNRKEVIFHVDVDKTFSEKEFKEDALTDEMSYLRNELEKLRRELRERPVVKTNTGGIDFVRTELPKSSGLFLVPMAGKIRSYSLTAKVYLGNEGLGVLLAQYNGKNPQDLNRVLVPSPQLFAMISGSRFSQATEKIIQSAGHAYNVQANPFYVQKMILQYLIRSRSFKETREVSGMTIIMTVYGSGIVISGAPVNGARLKTEAGISELLVGNVSARGISFQRY